MKYILIALAIVFCLCCCLAAGSNHTYFGHGIIGVGDDNTFLASLNVDDGNGYLTLHSKDGTVAILTAEDLKKIVEILRPNKGTK